MSMEQVDALQRSLAASHTLTNQPLSPVKVFFSSLFLVACKRKPIRNLRHFVGSHFVTTPGMGCVLFEGAPQNMVFLPVFPFTPPPSKNQKRNYKKGIRKKRKEIDPDGITGLVLPGKRRSAFSLENHLAASLYNHNKWGPSKNPGITGLVLCFLGKTEREQVAGVGIATDRSQCQAGLSRGVDPEAAGGGGLRARALSFVCVCVCRVEGSINVYKCIFIYIYMCIYIWL